MRRFSWSSLQVIVGVERVELEAIENQERMWEVEGIQDYQKCGKVKFEGSGCLSVGVSNKTLEFINLKVH